MTPSRTPTDKKPKPVFWRVKSYKGKKLIRTDDFRRKLTAEVYALGLRMNVGGFTKQIIEPLPMPSHD